MANNNKKPSKIVMFDVSKENLGDWPNWSREKKDAFLSKIAKQLISNLGSNESAEDAEPKG